jgi:CRISPR/Cas system CSM-associated protein Csm3 (group 7 of RAMP superfamily)
MFGMERIHGKITAKSPLHHGGNEKTGSVVMLNRMKYKLQNGEFQDIPYISGNAIRGVLRRLLIQDFFEQLGYALDVGNSSELKLYHAFFAGGILESVDKNATGQIDVKLKKKIIEYLPVIRLLGFSVGNQIVPSKLKVGHLLPACKELQHVMPDGVTAGNSFYELLTTAFQTRKDDVHAEREKDEQAMQMLIEYELFSPGTEFWHEFRIEDPDPIDLSCMARAIELWKIKPFLGGKSSIGMGQLGIEYDCKHSSKEYLDFVKKNKAEIIKTIKSI